MNVIDMVLRRIARCMLGPRLKSLECLVWTMSLSAVICLIYSLGKLQTHNLMENAIIVKPGDVNNDQNELSLEKLYKVVPPADNLVNDISQLDQHKRAAMVRRDTHFVHRGLRENNKLTKAMEQFVPPTDEDNLEEDGVPDELDGYNYFMMSEEETKKQENEEERKRQQRQHYPDSNNPFRTLGKNKFDSHIPPKRRNGWSEKPANVEFHHELKLERQPTGLGGRNKKSASALDRDVSNEMDKSGLKFLYIDGHGNKVYGAGFPSQKAAFQPLQINVNRGHAGNNEKTNDENNKSVKWLSDTEKSPELRKNSNEMIQKYLDKQSPSGKKKMEKKPSYRTLNLYVTTNGRFGNHLFQYASLYGLARATNRIPLLPPGTEIPDMFIKSRFSMAEGLPPHSIETVHEINSGIYSPSLYDLPPQDALVCCYLQSWKYFNNYKTMIKHLFRFKREIRNAAYEQLTSAKQTYFEKNPEFYKGSFTPVLTYVGVHVRRGDYMLKEHLQRGYKPASVSYIHRAMQYYRSKFSNCLFVVSSDDLSWSTQHLNGSDVAFLKGGSDHGVDLAALSACNHTIMTLGTYGWWAGWLAGGEVVYYKDWITKGSEIENSYNLEDYFLPEWKGIGDAFL